MDRPPPLTAQLLQQLLLARGCRLRPRQRFVRRLAQVGMIPVHLTLERQQGLIAVAVAQLLLGELRPQVLHQPLPVLPRGPAPRPGIAERTAELPPDTPRRPLPAETPH